ncbi:MAG: TatD family hydrolase [Planctomycetota bacterium]
MRICDPHIHMISRTTDDYEKMRDAGIELIVEPAFWLGEPRRHPETFFDYFRHICNFEHDRAAGYGIKHFVTLSVNPREANHREMADAVLKELPRFLDHPNVLGIGEIGLDQITPVEEDILRRQLLLAKERKMVVLIHTPHRNKLAGTRRIIEILKETDFPMTHAEIDHNTEETTPDAHACGAWCGHTVYYVTKLTPERAAAIVKENGPERMIVNSSADWGVSNPLAVPKTIEAMRGIGISERDIETVVWDNPIAFFRQTGRLKI